MFPASHSSTNGTQSPSMPSFPQMLKSKRMRTVAAVSSLLIVLLLSFAPSKYIRAFRADVRFGSQPPTSHLDTNVNWSRFAYVQYVTNTPYLCNSVMLFERLHALGTKADMLMMYPSKFTPGDATLEGRLLAQARDQYGVKLTPIEVQRRSGIDVTWAESFTKLLAFNQTQYDRVLGLDSDSTVLQLMDELFLLPSCPVAMPRAYWLPREEHFLSSQLILVEPSAIEFERVSKAIATAGPGEYDMEIFNNIYGDSALIIPHRRYDLLTRAFREDHRISYLGNDMEEWDPDKVLEEAKFLHFSDWPMTKPWIPDYNKMEELKPACAEENQGCRAQILWLQFYSDFARRRQVKYR
ncbi:N-acetylglucosaminyltransferase [Hyphodiscus hymeniophilus]|uniref:N-acetylglucosaminyltransferase n=1 Tax=Hyphodiscus hymeniophilus TaxID=353542 RepID=A0A9P7B1B0_9HELO|nr:N-acetylglucosaminyltransferase [Hyphodiscus hymeniophilus]